MGSDRRRWKGLLVRGKGGRLGKVEQKRGRERTKEWSWREWKKKGIFYAENLSQKKKIQLSF